MSPPPVRVETNASFRPSGEYTGRDSVAGFEIRRRDSPPVEGTAQMSPPETKAISDLSGDTEGSVKYNRGEIEDWLRIETANERIRNAIYRRCFWVMLGILMRDTHTRQAWAWEPGAFSMSNVRWLLCDV